MSVLLKELCNPDIDWLLANSQHLQVPAETMLGQPDQCPDHFYIVLEGGLSVFLAARSSDQAGLELTRLPSGDCWGQIPSLEHFLPSAHVKTLLPSHLLVISTADLSVKMNCDRAFAAHIYQTAAQLLSNRINSIAQRCGYSLGLLSQLHLKEAATVFGALEDSDLDWLIAVGELRTLDAQEILIRRGRPLDEFYIVIEGALGLSAPEQAQSPVLSAFAPADMPAQEFARLSRGDVLGESLLVATHPPLFTARALRETQVLAIPRWRLAAKLLYEADFAMRLYQVLAVLLANQQHNILQQLGFQNAPQELSHERLAKMSLAEARFDWMVKRLQTNGGK